MAPLCLRDNLRKLDALGADLQVDWSHQANGGGGGATVVSCRVESRPAAHKFVWSFVPLDALANWTESLASAGGESSSFELARLNASSSALKLNASDGPQLELSGQLGAETGLLLCSAENSLGWQKEPCAILIGSSGE